MQIQVIFVLFAMSAFTEGQWAAAARGLAQPIILSIGTVFTALKFSDNKLKEGEDPFSFDGYFDSKGNKVPWPSDEECEKDTKWRAGEDVYGEDKKKEEEEAKLK